MFGISGLALGSRANPNNVHRFFKQPACHAARALQAATMDEQFSFDLAYDPIAEASPLDAERVRREVLALLDEARGPARGWGADELRFRRILFPHLVSCLPDGDERDQLCFAFEREAERIARALAA